MPRKRTAKELVAAKTPTPYAMRKAAEAARKAEADAVLAKEYAEAEVVRKDKVARSKAASNARKAHKRINRYRIRDGVEGIPVALGTSYDPVILDDEPKVVKKWKWFIKLPIELRLKIVSAFLVLENLHMCQD